VEIGFQDWRFNHEEEERCEALVRRHSIAFPRFRDQSRNMRLTSAHPFTRG
jgi:hypothetical protein